MLCCEPRRQSKCLSTLRDLAIVMVEQAWIGELLPLLLPLLERLVKLVASHPLSVCLSVWRKLKLTKICYILPAHKVRPPTAEAPSHSLLLNSLPLSLSFSLLLQLDFFYFFFGCFVCFVLLLLLLLLKFATVHLYAEVRLQFFNIFYFFRFFFGFVFFLFFSFLIWVNSARQMNFLRFAFVGDIEHEMRCVMYSIGNETIIYAHSRCVSLSLSLA